MMAKIENLTQRLETKIEETSQDIKVDKEMETMSDKRENKIQEVGVTEAILRTRTTDNLDTVAVKVKLTVSGS